MDPNTSEENKNVGVLQNQVNEIQDIMKDNIDNALKRGENLDVLEDR